MARGKKREPLDIDEVIGLLSKSSLPTVIIEGSDDVIVFRRMEDMFVDLGLSVMPVGGRGNVLKMFSRLNEIANSKNIAFIADLDTWVTFNVPAQFISDRLVFTDGYSIENDIFRDGNLEEIMSINERTRFDIDIAKFIRWYALALNRFQDGRDNINLNLFPDVILDNPQDYVEKIRLNVGENYPDELHKLVLSDYGKYLRGKSLMQILSRQLSRNDRANKIHTSAFLEFVAAKPGPLLQQTYTRIGSLFKA
jgi:hypothetical protein